MSLDVSLHLNDTCVFDYNITHNLNKMADAAGVYKHLWRPDELNIIKAGELIEPLSEGLSKLVCNKADYLPLNPENGWGTYDGLVKFVIEYLAHCKLYPDATISISR